MNFKERAADLYAMMDENKTFEALEKYYAEDCVITEKPTGEVRNGKEAQKKAMQEWFDMIAEVHDGSTGFITSNEDAKVTMVQSMTDVTLKHGGRTKMEEIAVQQWNDDGQIIKEDFYYQIGPPPSFE